MLHVPAISNSAASSSLAKSANGSLRQALVDRLMLSEAVSIVGRLIACYPNGGGRAGDGYIGALAVILVSYPRMISQQSADPLKGVPRDCKFLPTPADVIAWCERETASLRRPVDVEDRYAALRRQSEELRAEGEYWQRARTQRPTLEELRAKHGPNWGLQDPLKPIRQTVPWDQQSPSWDEIKISPQLRAIVQQWLIHQQAA